MKKVTFKNLKKSYQVEALLKNPKEKHTIIEFPDCRAGLSKDNMGLQWIITIKNVFDRDIKDFQNMEGCKLEVCYAGYSSICNCCMVELKEQKNTLTQVIIHLC